MSDESDKYVNKSYSTYVINSTLQYAHIRKVQVQDWVAFISQPYWVEVESKFS